jgi:hypothetical protein
MIVQATRLFAAKLSLKYARMNSIRESTIGAVEMDMRPENIVAPFANILFFDLNPLILDLIEPVVMVLKDDQCLRQIAAWIAVVDGSLVYLSNASARL